MGVKVRVARKDLTALKMPQACASCGKPTRRPAKFKSVRESLAGAFLLGGALSFLFAKTLQLPVCEECSSSWGKPAKIDTVVFGKTADITFKCDLFGHAFKIRNELD